MWKKKNSNNKSETFPGYGKKKNREISTAIKSLFLVRHFKIERIQVIFLFWVIFICAAGTEDIWGCSSGLTVSAVTRLIFTWIWADLEESTELNQGIFFCCCWLVGFVSELCSDLKHFFFCTKCKFKYSSLWIFQFSKDSLSTWQKSKTM